MRFPLRLSVLALLLAAGGTARAQVDTFSGTVDVQPAPPPPAVEVPPPPVLNPYPVAPAYPPAPYPYAPPPPMPRVYTPPPPPVVVQPYYVYPPYYRPPVVYRAQLTCGQLCGRRPAPPLERVRRFSFGVHGTVLGINQQVGKDNVILGGAGFQFRFRGRGRVGLEVAQSFLHADYWNGNWQRDSFPFQLSLMVYLMPNDDNRHFNLYGLAGLGAMFDTIKLRDENRNMVSQDFLEWEGHVGLGAELRFKWFAIEADARAIGMLRDNSSGAAPLYDHVKGAPVSDKSYGFSGNLFLSLWF
jgi:hypothetical protein